MKSITTKGQLMSTTDYSIFELHEFNRDVKGSIKLERSMLKYGWIDAYPMHVVKNGGGKLKIKAGHHRFEIAKKLQIPVKYIVCEDGGISIHELESSTKGWSLNDYLESYVRSGIPNYLTIKNYVERTGIPLSCAISMFSGQAAGSNNKVGAFKDGKIEIVGTNHARQVEEIVTLMKNKGIDYAANSLFVQAISKVLFVKEFNVSRFKGKISTHYPIIEKQPNLAGWLDMIEAVYNRQAKEKLPVAFLAEKIASERKLTFGKSQK